MVELVVKLTEFENAGCENPENSQDSDDNYTTIGEEDSLKRKTGNHDGSNLGEITKVEAVIEGHGAQLDTETFYHVEYAGEGSTSDWFFFNSLDDVVYTVNVTSIRDWSWSDFSADENLFIIIESDGVSNTIIDQLAFKITYIEGEAETGVFICTCFKPADS